MIVWNWKYIQWEFVIESCRKQIHTGIIEHLEDRVRYRLIQSLFCFERPVQSRKMVCQYVEFAWDMTNSDHDIVFQAPMEDFSIPLRICWENVFLLVLLVEIMTQER